jgi:chemotaxis protein MotB
MIIRTIESCLKLSTVTIVLAGFMLITGCVTKGTYSEVVAERDEVLIENENLRQAVADEAEFALGLGTDLMRAESELEQLELEQAELADEVAEWAMRGAIKMQLLADGLHIMLPHDVLFASGSVALKTEGQELLAELAEEIKLQPYQIAVLGFTDNVPVGPKMQAQFPSNWEVAGARAASVVRLLQAEGVPPAQLVAVSLGENQPIATNETAEGRAQNRRIDVRIRPIIKN